MYGWEGVRNKDGGWISGGSSERDDSLRGGERGGFKKCVVLPQRLGDWSGNADVGCDQSVRVRARNKVSPPCAGVRGKPRRIPADVLDALRLCCTKL
jgi:hypothetical protein